MTTQKIEIFYKMIGNVEVPKFSRKEETELITYFLVGQKKRRLLVDTKNTNEQPKIKMTFHRAFSCPLWNVTLAEKEGFEL